MINWLRRHTPTWLLRCLVWRNDRLIAAGHPFQVWSWAYLDFWCRYDHRLDFGCNCDPPVGENCEECNFIPISEVHKSVQLEIKERG